ncbi:MAG: hypothetical protein N2170_04965 [Bacteroidia bacterium]|nr:hypothetical protein [Bacteroidia bacterium]
MASSRLSQDTLWRMVRALSVKERNRLRARIRGTRLEWLLRNLSQTEVYSEKKLYQAYKRKYPNAHAHLLRRYKRELWDMIEETLITPDMEELRGEIRIWRRFWMSVVLWQRGLNEAAQVLWHQSMTAAVGKGWYEVALWGISLLELYSRDFHRVASGEQVSAWSRSVIALVQNRYEAISEKIRAVEAQVRSRLPTGWTLPSLPSQDPWSHYMLAYADLLWAHLRLDFSEAYRQAVKMLHAILTEGSFLDPYRQFHLALSCFNMHIALLNLRAWELYRNWYALWNELRQERYWPSTPLYEKLHRMVLATHLAYLIRTFQWGAR